VALDLLDAGFRQIPLPTPFAVGRVNAYLVEDEPLTLIDPGPNSGDTLVALEAAMGEAGHRIEDLGLIVITHQHMDHFGLVDILARRSGAEVAALDLLVDWLAEFPRSMEADDAYAEQLMARHGVPADARSVLRAVAATFHGWGAAAAVTRPLHDGTTLALRDHVFAVSHRPGHSPSDTVLRDTQREILVAGDHLIGRISSVAAVARPLAGPGEPRPQPLVTYMASLRETQADPLRMVLSGHGEPVEDHRTLIDDRFVHYEKRRDNLERLIREQPRSAYELARELWGNVAVTQAFLTISEVLGHVDLLLNDGRVRELEDADGVVRFAAIEA
jgi:glyoxylase-like metal-dependent hydrolase (beta-lactamase superfamily II)